MSLFAVNGKEPFAVWCPSRDTSGNGTSTVNDLIGTRHGITNGTWVADTNAGGVRALALNGSDQLLNLQSVSPVIDFGPSWPSASISLWIKLAQATPTNSFQTGLLQTRAPFGGSASHYTWTDAQMYSSVFRNLRVESITPSGSIDRSVWNLLTITTNGTTYKVFQNITEIYSGGAEASVTFNNSSFTVGRSYDGNSYYYINGRIDDIRLFNVALDSSDVAYLYNSGNGRGRIASVPSYKRNHAFIGTGF